MNILIAEDDFISRKLLVNILEEQGHVVTVTSDGQEAWEAYCAQPSRLVITDWLMPRMDGLELVQRIRKEDHCDYTYMILLTANIGQRENYFKAMESGVDDFLAKPLDRLELEILGAGNFHQFAEGLRLEGGAPDEAAIDISLIERAEAFAGFIAAAVKDTDLGRGRGEPKELISSSRMTLCTSCAISGVAVLPVPIAQTGS
jgi:CheY-like chemotaxis protein